jgi:hypothetical protein
VAVLEVGKAGCFFFCIASLYEAAIHAFFVPGARWEQRLILASFRLLWAAYVCFMSGLVFKIPIRSNPCRNQRLTATLPVRLFFWSSAGIVVLFLTSWYLDDLSQEAAGFISSRPYPL